MRAVVLVFPCVPAIAATRPRFTTAPSASARFQTGIPRCRARRISGWSGGTAEVMTSPPAEATWAGS